MRSISIPGSILNHGFYKCPERNPKARSPRCYNLSMRRRDGFATALLVVIIAIFTIGAGYWFVVSKNKTQLSTTNSQTVPVITTTDKSLNWATYRVPFLNSKTSTTLQLQYPVGYSISANGDDQGYLANIEIKNFEWNKDAYFFPSTNYLPQDKFLMWIILHDLSKNDTNLSIQDWLSKYQNYYESPEGIQIVGEYPPIKGNLVSQKQIYIGGNIGLQRIIEYKGNKGNIDLVFSYTMDKGKIYKIVGPTIGDSLSIYNQILSSLKLP
jgi:hypothetical protein